jgi:hypothetical protein
MSHVDRNKSSGAKALFSSRQKKSIAHRRWSDMALGGQARGGSDLKGQTSILCNPREACTPFVAS